MFFKPNKITNLDLNADDKIEILTNTIMNLNIKDKKFLVLGASSGFGRQVAERISMEGGHPVLVARSEGKLLDFQSNYPNSSIIQADLFTSAGIQKVLHDTKGYELSGVLVNCGGPPAGSFPLNNMEEWDKGYEVVLRWKIELLRTILPRMESMGYGRIVFIESVSVRQPISGLVLSNVFRMSVVGLVKSIVNDLTGKDILLNIIAPGYHRTDRLENLISNQSEDKRISTEEVAQSFAENTTLKKLGDPRSLAELAVWLLSPQNSYLTGQTITVDGGLAKGV